MGGYGISVVPPKKLYFLSLPKAMQRLRVQFEFKVLTNSQPCLAIFGINIYFLKG